MAFVFVLALLMDSACTAACIPAELEAPARHCASPHGSEPSERGCDLHGHLKPAVNDRSPVTAAPIAKAPAPLETPATLLDLASFRAAAVLDVLYVPPLLHRSSVLRI